MKFRYYSSSLVIIAALSACSGGGGGGGGGGGTTALPVVNDDNAVLGTGGGSLSVQADGGVDVSVSADADFDAGDFTGGSDLNAEGDGTIVAISEGGSTFAAFVLTRDEGASVDAFFGRTVASDGLPSGTATLTGSYVGAFVDEDQDPTRSYISGDVNLSVDLDEQTFGGTVTNLSSEVFGTSETTALPNIDLPSLTISDSGTFAGSASQSITDAEGEQETTITTTVDGLLGGSTLANLEAVGTIDTSTVVTGGPTQAQSGVFIAD